MRSPDEGRSDRRSVRSVIHRPRSGTRDVARQSLLAGEAAAVELLPDEELLPEELLPDDEPLLELLLERLSVR